MIDIYYLEDDRRIAQAVKEFLAQGGCHVCVFSTFDEIKEAMNVMRPAEWNWQYVMSVDTRKLQGNTSSLCGGAQQFTERQIKHR